jgi:hypothetical protein
MVEVSFFSPRQLQSATHSENEFITATLSDFSTSSKQPHHYNCIHYKPLRIIYGLSHSPLADMGRDISPLPHIGPSLAHMHKLTLETDKSSPIADTDTYMTPNEVNLPPLYSQTPFTLAQPYNTPNPFFGSVREKSLHSNTRLDHELNERTDARFLIPSTSPHYEDDQLQGELQDNALDKLIQPVVLALRAAIGSNTDNHGHIDQQLLPTDSEPCPAHISLPPAHDPTLSSSQTTFKKPALSPTTPTSTTPTKRKRKHTPSLAPAPHRIYTSPLYAPAPRRHLAETLRFSLRAPLGHTTPYAPFRSSAHDDDDAANQPSSPTPSSYSSSSTCDRAPHTTIHAFSTHGTDPVTLLGKHIHRVFALPDRSCMLLLDSNSGSIGNDSSNSSISSAYLASFIRAAHLPSLRSNRWAQRPDADSPHPASFPCDEALQAAAANSWGGGAAAARQQGQRGNAIVEVAVGERVSNAVDTDCDGRVSVRRVRHRVIGFKTAAMGRGGEGLGFVWCERVTPPGLTRLEFFDVVLDVEEIGGEEFRRLVEELGEEGDGLEVKLQRALEQDEDEEMGEDVEVDAVEGIRAETLLREISLI